MSCHDIDRYYFSAASVLVLAAVDLSEKQPDFAAKGVKLVGVVHEKLGVEEFSDCFKNGEIYFDKEKAFYNGEDLLSFDLLSRLPVFYLGSFLGCIVCDSADSHRLSVEIFHQFCEAEAATVEQCRLNASLSCRLSDVTRQSCRKPHASISPMLSACRM